MESVVNYLDDTEKKIVKEVAELFSKMREQSDRSSLQGIEDMYSSTPVEGIIYEPYVKIPMSLGPRKGHYYSTDFILPKDEYVVFINESTHQWQRGQSWDAPTYNCIALTSHGRCFLTKQVSESRTFPTNCFMEYSTYTPESIIKLDPIPYKIPKQIFKTFLLAFKLGNINITSLHPGIREPINQMVIQSLSDTTNTLQELNKEFYLFAGKWKPHMTAHATLDVDTMRQTIIDNTHSIEELKGKGESLEQQNKRLQAELKELKEQKDTLEKEKAKLLPLEKYKEAVLEFMEEHYPNEEVWDNDDTLDADIIRIFSKWHSNKVFMDEWVYNDVMDSKEELNEYRIYKKVKGEMVSSGMDNSSVARNVRSIKKSVNDLKHQSST
jgi:hypothetical protein